MAKSTKSKSEVPEVKTGVIKFYLPNKGYGFLTDSSDGIDYFFHASNTEEKDLMKEEKISFLLETGSRGVKAIDIKRVETNI